MIRFFSQYGSLKLKTRFWSVKVGLWYMDVLNPFSLSTNRKVNTFLPTLWTESWSTWVYIFQQYLYSSLVWPEYEGFISRTVDISVTVPKTISPKYCMYMSDFSGIKGEPIVKPPSSCYMWDHCWEKVVCT